MDIFKGERQKEPRRMVYEEPPYTLSELLHEASKINEETGMSFRRRIGKIMGTEYFVKLTSRSFKSYPTSQSLSLTGPGEFEDTASSEYLRDAVTRRRSIRQFSGEPITLNNLSNIIFNAYGITGKITLNFGVEEPVRAVPSGGGLYPLELYVASHKIEGLPPGIYHYNVLKHSLELVREGQFSAELGRALFYEEMFKGVSAAFLITGILKRSSIKYGERAYRFMMLEAGHVGQNICLTSFSLNLGCLMLGGFYDDDVDRILGIDGVSETTLYASAVGHVG
jgi:SagB-type dehydrogenase family enzyme